MVIDVHVHPFCKEAHYGDRKRIANVMSGYDPIKLKRVSRMVNAIMEQYTLDDYISIMDKFNIDKAVIVSLNVTSAYGFLMVSNEDVADFVKSFLNRFIGFACADVPATDAMDQLEYSITSLNLKGIKILPPAQKFDISDKKYDPLWQKMIDLDIPLWTHGGLQVSFYGSIAKYGHPLLIDEVALRHRTLTIIIGHMGVPWMWDAWSMVSRHKNVYIDISAHPNLYNWLPWDAFISEDLSHKILFASDYSLKHYSEILNAFDKVQINDSLKRAILEKSAAKLLNL
ncbi:MAG: amidohydrolase [Candidatus Lokiarchaeota archaeon]|nr:amidohydrolase [Candidatus Lokiarchaeota archaeon]